MTRRNSDRSWLTSGEVAERVTAELSPVSKRTIEREAARGRIDHTWSLDGEVRVDKRGVELRGHRRFTPEAVAEYIRKRRAELAGEGDQGRT
jgi:hypothetical protein